MSVPTYLIRRMDVSVLCDTPQTVALAELVGNKDRRGHRESAWWGHPSFSALPDGTVILHLPMNVHNLALLHQCGAVPALGDPETCRRLAFFRKRPGTFQSALPLKLFQGEGGQWLIEHDLTAILAFDVGLGKTLTSLAVMLSDPARFFPAIVIAPAHIKLNWADPTEGEWVKWGGKPDEAVALFGRTPDKAEIRGKKLIVLNHHILAAWADTLIEIGPKTMLVDEAHNFVNSTAKTYPIALKVAKACAGRVLLLTATPLVNALGDLWSLCNLINPDILGGKGVFESTFMPEEEVKDRLFASRWRSKDQMCWRDVSKAKLPKILKERRLLELKDVIHKTIILRKKKSEVIDQLPDVIETHLRIVIPETTKEGIAFWDIERKCAAEIAEAKDDILAADQLLPAMSLAKSNVAMALIPYAEEWLRDFLAGSEETEKVVVVGWSVEPLKQLHALFKKESLLINGDVDAKRKQVLQIEFNENPDKRIVFGNMRSIGTGVDKLVAAATELFIELPPNDMGLKQIKGRIDRLSQKARGLRYVYMTIKGSYEEKNGWKLIKRKQALANTLDL